MVFDGSKTISPIGQGKYGLLVTIIGFDADTEDSHALAPVDLEDQKLIKLPRHFVWWVERTAGTENVISVNVYASEDGVTWTDLGNVTAKDTRIQYPAATVATPQVFRYLKGVATTVGTGNTLSIVIRALI